MVPLTWTIIVGDLLVGRFVIVPAGEFLLMCFWSECQCKFPPCWNVGVSVFLDGVSVLIFSAIGSVLISPAEVSVLDPSCWSVSVSSLLLKWFC